ncbi:hypothetical protein [Caldithrix abyssi]|uniref:Rho termination factor N-terminal domain-containing protein n=2 Tax=Caldithrix abyssi TaxID=187145 RepID=H1XPS6_CALAY|nr:hypothetical protein Cabys_3674 [Caldithrix abyssi DSM 13497]EHO41052.1 hypothetical protein Calab_1431 [Caldithrix abyssi DSM 13497]
MEYTYQDLKRKTVAELREIAAAFENQEAVQGYTQLNKEHLIELLCKAMNIDMHEHHVSTLANKGEIKRKIRMLKVERDKAIEAKDYKKLKEVRKEIKKMKNKLRAAMV